MKKDVGLLMYYQHIVVLGKKQQQEQQQQQNKLKPNQTKHDTEMDKQEYSLQDTGNNPTLCGSRDASWILCPVLGTQQSHASISKCPEDTKRTIKGVENMV